MSFTDEDLKRLKEDIGNGSWLMSLSGNHLSALLARLEAAEKVAGYVCHCDRNDLDRSRDCPCPELHKAWLRSKGDAK